MTHETKILLSAFSVKSGSCFVPRRFQSGSELNGVEVLNPFAELLERDFLDLTDALARHAELLADLFQRFPFASIQPESLAENRLLTRVERPDHFVDQRAVRFLFELLVEYPSLEDEKKVVEQHSFTPLDKLQPVLSREEVLRFRNAIAQVPAAPNVVDYAVRLVRATRPSNDGQTQEYIKRWIRWGASPRASQYLVLAGRARAACEGRFNVACDDVAALAPLILRHRLIRSFQADAEGQTTDQIIQRLLDDVPR